MKNIFLITFFFFSSSFFAQNRDIQTLLEVCYKYAAPKDFEYFNLVDSSFIMTSDRLYLSEIDDKEFLNEYNDFNMQEFAEKAASTPKINWKHYKCPKAIIYSIDSIPKFPGMVRNNTIVLNNDENKIKVKFINYNHLRVEAGKNKSEEEINKAIDSAWEDYEKNTRKEKKIYFKFSTPIFSYDKKYAVIMTKTSGSGGCFICMRKGNSWKIIYRFGNWVS